MKKIIIMQYNSIDKNYKTKQKNMFSYSEDQPLRVEYIYV